MRILDFLNEFKSMSKANHFDFLDDSSFDGSLSARGPMSLFSDSEDDVANPRGSNKTNGKRRPISPSTPTFLSSNATDLGLGTESLVMNSIAGQALLKEYQAEVLRQSLKQNETIPASAPVAQVPQAAPQPPLPSSAPLPSTVPADSSLSSILALASQLNLQDADKPAKPSTVTSSSPTEMLPAVKASPTVQVAAPAPIVSAAPQPASSVSQITPPQLPSQQATQISLAEIEEFYQSELRRSHAALDALHRASASSHRDDAARFEQRLQLTLHEARRFYDAELARMETAAQQRRAAEQAAFASQCTQAMEAMRAHYEQEVVRVVGATQARAEYEAKTTAQAAKEHYEREATQQVQQWAQRCAALEGEMRRMRDAMDRQHGYMPRVTAGGGADTEYYERELARLNAERMDREAALHAAEQRAMSAQETALSAQAELAQKEAEFDREFSDAEAIIENMRNANQHLQNVLANHIQTNHLNPAVEAAASAAAAAAAAADSQSMERRTSTALGSTGNMEKVRELEDQLSKLRAKLATATEHEDEAHQAAEVAAQRAQRAEQECAEARAAVLMAQADAAEANDGKRGLEATLKQKKEDLATMQAQIDTQMRELNVLKAEVRELKFVIEDQKSHAQDMRRDRHEVEAKLGAAEKQSRALILDAEALRKQVSAEKMRAEKFEREAQVLRDQCDTQRAELRAIAQERKAHNERSVHEAAANASHSLGHVSPRQNAGSRGTHLISSSEMHGVFRHPDAIHNRVSSPPRYGPASTTQPVVLNAPIRRAGNANRESSDFTAAMSAPEVKRDFDVPSLPPQRAPPPPLPQATVSAAPSRGVGAPPWAVAEPSAEESQNRRSLSRERAWGQRTESPPRASARQPPTMQPPYAQSSYPPAQPPQQQQRQQPGPRSFDDDQDRRMSQPSFPPPHAQQQQYHMPPPPPPVASYQNPQRHISFDDAGGGDDDDIEAMIAALEAQNNQLRTELPSDDRHAPPNARAPPGVPPFQPRPFPGPQYSQPATNRMDNFDDVSQLARGRPMAAAAPSTAPFANADSFDSDSAYNAKESEVARLQLERQQLEAEFAKMPPQAPRTVAGRTHKARMEARLKILDEDINKLKSDLRAMR